MLVPLGPALGGLGPLRDLMSALGPQKNKGQLSVLGRESVVCVFNEEKQGSAVCVFT